MNEIVAFNPSMESQKQYIYRICALKDEYELTWTQVANIINEQLGKDCSESTYRKSYQKNSNVKYDDESQIKALDITKERQKLYATKVENTRIARQVSRQELFYENIGYTIKTLPLPYNERVDFDIIDQEEEYVLTIADLQAGSKFDLDDNHYSLEECSRRFDILFQRVVEIVKKNNIHKLNIVELGDTIQGILRISDVQLNETSVVNSTVVVSRLIANFLNNISSLCDVEYYHTPSSNHSQIRPLGTKASELSSEDIEFVIGNYIMDMLRNNKNINVNLNFGYDYIPIKIFNFNVIALHGHTIKSLESALKDLSVMHRKLLDYVLIGHFHNGKVIPGNAHEYHDTELLVSPSFQGVDPFAFNKLGLSSKAACNLYVFDKKYGHTITQKIILN